MEIVTTQQTRELTPEMVDLMATALHRAAYEHTDDAGREAHWRQHDAAATHRQEAENMTDLANWLDSPEWTGATITRGGAA